MRHGNDAPSRAVRHFLSSLVPSPGSPPIHLLCKQASYLPLYSPPCSRRPAELPTALLVAIICFR